MVSGLYLGDCLEVLPTLPAASVDLVLADPPYGSTRCHWDSQIDLARLWPELKRISRGAIVLFAQTPFDKVLGASNLEMLRYEWIWEKANATGHLNANRAPMKAHENILVFYKHQPPYTPIKTSGHERKTVKRRLSVETFYGGSHGKPYDSTERYPRSVLRFAQDKGRARIHKTQKPVELLDYLIRTYTVPGGVVLDFCMGSGSTGVAANLADRRFIGIESDPAIFRGAEMRLHTSLAQAA
jgi:DNA modification methylase